MSAIVTTSSGKMTDAGAVGEITSCWSSLGSLGTLRFSGQIVGSTFTISCRHAWMAENYYCFYWGDTADNIYYFTAKNSAGDAYIRLKKGSPITGPDTIDCSMGSWVSGTAGEEHVNPSSTSELECLICAPYQVQTTGNSGGPIVIAGSAQSSFGVIYDGGIESAYSPRVQQTGFGSGMAGGRFAVVGPIFDSHMISIPRNVRQLKMCESAPGMGVDLRIGNSNYYTIGSLLVPSGAASSS